jgi:hypothetical protein
MRGRVEDIVHRRRGMDRVRGNRRSLLARLLGGRGSEMHISMRTQARDGRSRDGRHTMGQCLTSVPPLCASAVSHPWPLIPKSNEKHDHVTAVP